MSQLESNACGDGESLFDGLENGLIRDCGFGVNFDGEAARADGWQKRVKVGKRKDDCGLFGRFFEGF